MFRRDVKSLDDILQKFLRDEGLETPLLQKRLMDAWDGVVGETVSRYTTEKFIKNQVLYVKIINPALRQDFLFFGAADGARTRDPRRDRPVL